MISVGEEKPLHRGEDGEGGGNHVTYGLFQEASRLCWQRGAADSSIGSFVVPTIVLLAEPRTE